MSEYVPTIGLEIHAELKTRTKMFCNSKNDPDEARPNVNVCPICMGHPGTLPGINKEAVKHVVRVGTAVGGTIADYTEFDRKNYFYPDLPKGYQISQYTYPLVLGGTLNGIQITRIHLEEDTARSIHSKEYSFIDFNRAGIPLMELVTEPVIHSPEEAGAFARELRLLLRTLKAGEANMEKGEMRVEANVSVGKGGVLGTKVEVKNLNSFRAVEQAITYEVKRHIELLEKGDSIVQETRGWDENKQKTFSQRLKEESHDYRYFPEPDLPKLWLSELPEFSKETIQKELPELPWERRERYRTLGIKDEDIELFLHHATIGPLFNALVERNNDTDIIKRSANYLASDVVALLQDGRGTHLTPEGILALMKMAQDETLSSRGVKDVLAVLHIQGGDPESIAKDKNLLQKSNEEELRILAQKLITQHQNVAEDYTRGKEASLHYLVGQGMKETKGSANPKMLQAIFKELLH